MNIEGNETVILKLKQHPLNAALCTKVHKGAAMVAPMHRHILKHLVVTKYVQNYSSDIYKQIQEICTCKKCMSTLKLPLFKRLWPLQYNRVYLNICISISEYFRTTRDKNPNMV